MPLGRAAMIERMKPIFRQLCSDQSGATVIEYALIVLFIGLVVINLQTSIGNSVVGFFMSVANGL